LKFIRRTLIEDNSETITELHQRVKVVLFNHIEIDHKSTYRAHPMEKLHSKNISMDLTSCDVYVTFDININTNRYEFKIPGIYINTIKMWI